MGPGTSLSRADAARHQPASARGGPTPASRESRLGGGNALLAHGVISRPTQDAGLFTGQEHGVQAAAGFVEAALRGAGFRPERQDQAAG